MLTKTPKSGFKIKRVLGLTATAFIAIEAVGFICSYGVWYRLNSDREFRFYMRNNYNWVLEGYYGIGERFGKQNTREIDHKIWSTEGKI